MPQYIGTKLVNACPAPAPDSVRGENKPGDPGYKVIYDNGYESWSPKAVFEEAYRSVDGMSFGLAIEAMKKGIAVSRNGWHKKGMYIEIQEPDEMSANTLPYIYITIPTGVANNAGVEDFQRVPWLASQTDMLADDWFLVA